MQTFKYWCYKVLPLVYDDSLSYYELLCKVIDYINNLIAEDKIIESDIAELQNAIAEIEQKIKDLQTSDIEKLIEAHLATMIFVQINDAGYITYYIPESWDNIIFNTTGLDINISGYDYGHLVLSY